MHISFDLNKAINKKQLITILIFLWHCYGSETTDTEDA